ncbi:ABC transporter substrate-binding protein [uncultured Brachyspira sp.]|uniref:ABC transporter substrate-binding protein n=1 Tax=uncultured Brachyspira sp. TaxID=221953 RepID=UPI00262E832B|nr:ABC transporter substrate-binding protein [uncultured Brachyspira sp.]
MMKFRIVFLVLFAALSISCKEKTSNTADEIKTEIIRVGYMPDFSGTSAAAIAQEKGYFQEEGLNVVLLKFLDGPSEINAMLSNNLDFAYIGHGAHSLAIQGKVNVLFPNGLSKSEQIIARKSSGINTILDLKGKTVAAQFGTSSEIFLNLAINKLGINKDELNILDMNGPNIVSAMTNGTIDAASVQAPYTFSILNTLGDEAVPIASIIDYSDSGAFPSSWVVTPEYQNANPDIVNRFSRAILKAMDYRANNMNEAVEIVARQNNSPIETVALEKETALWFSGQNVKEAYLNGKAAEWYKSQQNVFIYTKTITNTSDISKYVQIKYMIDNVFNN